MLSEWIKWSRSYHNRSSRFRVERSIYCCRNIPGMRILFCCYWTRPKGKHTEHRWEFDFVLLVFFLCFLVKQSMEIFATQSGFLSGYIYPSYIHLLLLQLNLPLSNNNKNFTLSTTNNPFFFNKVRSSTTFCHTLFFISIIIILRSDQ